MQKDFETIKNALSQIFKKKDHFQYFTEKNMTGWEKWLQIELALQLNQIGESKIEDPFFYHMGKLRPMSKNKFEKCFIDLTFRVKNSQRKTIGAIELKVTKSQNGLKAAFSDLYKISAIKTTNWKFRSVTAILIHPTKDKETKFKRLKEELLNHNLKISDGLNTQTMSIPNSNFELIMIGWEESLNKNMTTESYRLWIKKVREIFNKHDAKPKLNSVQNINKHHAKKTY
jgi:hypothetical protein